MFTVNQPITPLYVVLLIAATIAVGRAAFAGEYYGFRAITKFFINLGAMVIAQVLVLTVAGDPFRPPLVLNVAIPVLIFGRLLGRERRLRLNARRGP